MQIIHHLIIDMTRPLPQPPVGAVQGDGCTRAVQMTLLQNGEAWEVPAGVTAAVAFRKPDKTRGLYDRLPDGTSAVTIDGSTVTAVLAPQVLSCAGEVSAAVVFHDADLNQLASFPFAIRVAANPAAGQTVSSDYYRYSNMEEVSDAVEAALASLEESKQAFLAQAEQALAVVHDTAAADAPAIVCEATGTLIAAADASGRPLQGLTLYGKTTQDGTPTPESPAALESVGAGGAVTATVCGRNLIKFEPNLTTSTYGIVFSAADGGTRLKGTSTDKYAQNTYSQYDALDLPTGQYTLKTELVNDTNSISVGVIITRNGANWIDVVNGKYKTITIEEGYSYGCFVYMIQSEKTVDCVVRAMLVPGTEAAEWEAYKEPQTLTVSTPNGLPGIPVESGGSYTDESGQSWICDEIDYARGVYVQRIRKDVLDGDEAWGVQNDLYFIVNRSDSLERINPPLLSSVERVLPSVLDAGGYGYAFAYGHRIRFENMNPDNNTVDELKAYLAENPITVLYARAEPIETDLTAEELAAFAALHSNKPNTTVFNDGGAGMKLSYTADTKTYIDQKLAAISAALLNT